MSSKVFSTSGVSIKYDGPWQYNLHIHSANTVQNTTEPRGAVSQVFQTMTSYDEIWTGHAQKHSATIAEASIYISLISLLPKAATDRLFYNSSSSS